ncbi:MAG: hypothetical protein JST16_05720 [Bdellovibrionales bacterium]|nr:hypothetical protein [Bdellovibrionales bacterium]
MGLVFPLQPDLRASKPQTLVLSSSKKKFGLGGSFVFGGVLLGTMFLAASPLFKIFWEQGNWFDRMITLAVITPIVCYPILALICWFYQERVSIQKRADGHYDCSADERVFGLRWNKREATRVDLHQLQVENWVGSRNVASSSGTPDRYATKGHWMLMLNRGTEPIRLERRAKKEEIDFLKAQIDAFFSPASTPKT